jgi:TFIIF-interacting CTD phosphatase-like protein
MGTNKPNLVLDLDETLVKSIINFKVFDTSFKGDFKLNGNVYNVYFRNNVENFIDEMFEYFDIYIYSNGTQDYVINVINMFRNKNKIKNIFARKDLNENMIKSLLKYNLVTKNTLIIDDRLDIWDKESVKRVLCIKKFEYHPFKFSNKNCLNNISGIIKKYYQYIFTEYFPIYILKMMSEYLVINI